MRDDLASSAFGASDQANPEIIQNRLDGVDESELTVGGEEEANCAETGCIHDKSAGVSAEGEGSADAANEDLVHEAKRALRIVDREIGRNVGHDTERHVRDIGSRLLDGLVFKGVHGCRVLSPEAAKVWQ